MDFEKHIVSLLLSDNTQINAGLHIYEEAPEDDEMVLLELNINGETYIYKHENCFFALQEMRTELEKRGIKIQCNGAARNVYPSPMQLSMGVGRAAYKTYFGQQARMKDVVDIFEHEEGLEFVSVNEQAKYHDEWLKSL